MCEVNNNKMQKIKGGAALSISSALNAVTKAAMCVFNIGQAVGSAIRRGLGGRMCNY